MVMEDHIRMCRFVQNGEPTMGEYIEEADGTGICRISELDGSESTDIVVSYPDGTMPDAIGDLEIFNVSMQISDGAEDAYHMPIEIQESLGKTRLILDEYEMGVLDEKEAGDALFDHLFGEGRKKINAEWRTKGYI